MPELVKTIHRQVAAPKKQPPSAPEIGAAENEVVRQIKALIAGRIPAAYPTDWTAIKLIEGDTAIR